MIDHQMGQGIIKKKKKRGLSRYIAIGGQELKVK